MQISLVNMHTPKPTAAMRPHIMHVLVPGICRMGRCWLKLVEVSADVVKMQTPKLTAAARPFVMLAMPHMQHHTVGEHVWGPKQACEPT